MIVGGYQVIRVKYSNAVGSNGEQVMLVPPSNLFGNWWYGSGLSPRKSPKFFHTPINFPWDTHNSIGTLHSCSKYLFYDKPHRVLCSYKGRSLLIFQNVVWLFQNWRLPKRRCYKNLDDSYKQQVEEKSYFNRHIMPRFDIIEGYARMGYSNKEIAEKLGIVPLTFERYLKRDDPKYLQLVLKLERGREQTDILVENALLKRALGYKYKEITKERKMDNEGNYSLEITKVVQKDVQPDVGACEYWLEHRASKRWQINPIAEANEQMANEAILKIADLINNPVPMREPDVNPEEEYEKLAKQPLDNNVPDKTKKKRVK